MKPTQLLHDLGQSLWLDNITRDLLDSGTLKSYIDELSVTGLTSNPTIFDQAIKKSAAYDSAILDELGKGKSGEALFFDLALDDLTRAADLFRPTYDQTKGVDGWVSLEVSPLLAYDTATTLAAAEAYLKGIERRIAAGLPANVGSVASVFISRWDVAANPKVPDELRDKLGIAIAQRTYKAYRDLLLTPRWQKIIKAGYNPQRLLLASTGTKDPKASDILYIKALAAPDTVNTMPEGTLKAFADHGEIGAVMPLDGGDCEQVLQQFTKAGVDIDALGLQLQVDGAKAFVSSWNELLGVIESKSAVLK